MFSRLCAQSPYFIPRLPDILYQQQRDYGSLRWSSGNNTVFAVWRLFSKYGVSIDENYVLKLLFKHYTNI